MEILLGAITTTTTSVGIKESESPLIEPLSFEYVVHNRAERKELFQKFANNSTLHGLSYVFDKNAHTFERCFWACCGLLSIVATIYTCVILSNKYTNSSIVTIVENSQYPVFIVQFPAVAVCTHNRINRLRTRLAQKKFLPENASNETIRAFNHLVKYMNSFKFKSFERLAGIEHEPLHLVDSISITKLAEFMAFRCEEIFHPSCWWSEKPFPCCKTFVQERTTLGVCWVFNSLISQESKQKSRNDKYYPFHNSKHGEGSGLRFSTKHNISTTLTGSNEMFGIELLIKKSDQWSDSKIFRPRLKTYNGLIIRPEALRASSYLTTFPPSIRQCVFQSEKHKFDHIPGLKYRQYNCRTFCVHKQLAAFCNCSLPLMLGKLGKKFNVRECTASDLVCLYKNRDVLENMRRPNEELLVRQHRHGTTCNCMTSCDAINYQVSLNMVPLHNNSDELYTTQVDIYYQSEVILQYLSMYQFTTAELVSYFGGIVTLFLGASIIFSYEVAHLLLLELTSYLLERMARKRITLTTTNHLQSK